MGNLQLVRRAKTVAWWGMVVSLVAVGMVRISNRFHPSYGTIEFRAKSLIGTITRMNQAHFLENSKFVTSIAELEEWKKVKVPTEESLYDWTIAELPGPQPMLIITAVPHVFYRDRFRSFSAAIRPLKNGEPFMTETIVCEAPKPAVPLVKFENHQGPLTCPGNAFRLNR